MPKIAPFLLNRKLPGIPFTEAGYAKLLEEKNKLEAQRPDAVENLRRAREMGDLSENGYYKASRQRLSFIDARLRRLAGLIKRAVIVASSGADAVEIGRTVTLRTGSREVTYTIVGGYESDPSRQTISHISPLGKSLIGKKTGDSVEVRAPAGIMTYTIVAIA